MLLGLKNALLQSTKAPVVAGSQTYSSPGTYSFVVPEYNTFTAEVVGGGGAGASSHSGDSYAGGNGGSSSFNGLTGGGANGGGGSKNGGFGINGGLPGSGSGGSSNWSGEQGTANGAVMGQQQQLYYGGASGAGVGARRWSDWSGMSIPGMNGHTNYASGYAGNAPGGGGSGVRFISRDAYDGSIAYGCCPCGGGGGRATRTWTLGEAGAPVPGQTLTVVVGAGGANNYGNGQWGGVGAAGRVALSWS